MANKTIAQLDTITPASADVIPIWDISEGKTGKATLANIAPIIAKNIDVDNIPTSGSSNAVSSNGLYNLLVKTVGLLNASNSQFPKPSLGNDINNYIYPGVYQVTGPEDYGVVLVLGTNINELIFNQTWIWQVYFGVSGSIYVRQAINPSQLPPTSSDWSTWKQVNLV